MDEDNVSSCIRHSERRSTFLIWNDLHIFLGPRLDDNCRGREALVADDGDRIKSPLVLYDNCVLSPSDSILRNELSVVTMSRYRYTKAIYFLHGKTDRTDPEETGTERCWSKQASDGME